MLSPIPPLLLLLPSMIHRSCCCCCHRDLMHHHQHYPLLLLILLLIPLLHPSLSEPNNQNFSDCFNPTLYSCGDYNYNISFPFGSPNRPNHCSYPAFHLTCNYAAQVLLIDIREKGEFFQVKYIDYANQVLTVVNPDFAGASCPRVFSDPDLNFNLVAYTALDVNLTVYINCTPDPTLPPNLFHEITCLAGHQSYYSFEEEILPELSGKCDSIGIVPMNQTVVNSMAKGEKAFVDALHDGFGVKWVYGQEWCGGCLESGGVCGYDAGDPIGRTCFCPDRTSKTGTCASGGSNWKNIAIGVGVGGGFLIVAAACFLWFWRQRKKRRQISTSMNFIVRSASSDPSSLQDPEFGSTNYHTHLFSYDELQEATNGFDASRELGDGGFGTVYKGKLRDGRIVAVKRLYENNYKRVEQFMNEVEILSRLRHQNLVTLYGCTSRHSRELLLVYEFVSNGTVADHLHGPRVAEGALTWLVRLSIAIETAEALAYLHAVEPQIIHRDVKTNNILLDDNFHVKVADFGLSRLFPLDATHVSTLPQGTPGYVDPDYHQCYQLTDKSDVYSFGVVLVELISSKPAVDISRHRHEINLANMAINKIQNRELEELIDPGLGYRSDQEKERMITMVAELAFRCLQGEKDMRPSIKEVLEELRLIKNRGYGAEKGVEADDQTREESQLLKKLTPFSPDSVTDRWESRLTTPNISE